MPSRIMLVQANPERFSGFPQESTPGGLVPAPFYLSASTRPTHPSAMLPQHPPGCRSGLAHPASSHLDSRLVCGPADIQYPPPPLSRSQDEPKYRVASELSTQMLEGMKRALENGANMILWVLEILKTSRIVGHLAPACERHGKAVQGGDTLMHLRL